MEKAVEWYHQQLLTAPAARQARDYLRARGLSGDVARRFRLGWAPDDWDALSRDLGVGADILRDTGLAFTNKAGRVQDSFRARVMFPIFDLRGRPVAYGGRVMSPDEQPKYLNSPDTPLFHKGQMLYGLSLAREAAAAKREIIVAEGYMDVIALAQAGRWMPRNCCRTVPLK